MRFKPLKTNKTRSIATKQEIFDIPRYKKNTATIKHNKIR